MMYQQISYQAYCALGGAKNPGLFSRPVYLGTWYMYTAYYLCEMLLENE
jgi:alpha-glucosidase (family GH31 glycosyl hydrolase)